MLLLYRPTNAFYRSVIFPGLFLGTLFVTAYYCFWISILMQYPSVEPVASIALKQPNKRDSRCRSLFSIGDDTSFSDVGNGIKISSEIKETMRNIARKKISGIGLSTEDYYDMVKLLPNVLLGQSANEEERDKTNERETGKEKEIKHLDDTYTLNKSRITNGTLPYVPCVIKNYNDFFSIRQCFKMRLKASHNFWIVFMGDSKIRILFQEFIIRTDPLFHFNMKFKNYTEPWAEVKKKRYHQDVMYIDMEATTPVEPRLRITFRFRKFDEVRPSALPYTKEIQELRRWCSAEETLPNLLVIGYTPWMLMKQKHGDTNRYRSTVDALTFLYAMHQRVVPLLEEISQRTRVLVLPQSRLKPHTYSSSMYKLGAFSNANTDWSEMIFLYLLQQYREKSNSPFNPIGKDNPLQRFSKDHSIEHIRNYSSSNTSRLLNEQRRNIKKSRMKKKLTQLSSQTFSTNFEDKAVYDHLSSTNGKSGLWWWDSSLPLNLAGILECNALFHLGYKDTSLYKSEELRCEDFHHASSTTLSDLVTMMLNLLCNSFMQDNQRFCCS